MKCIKCGSHAINSHLHGRDGSDTDLCDVCYWRKRADKDFNIDSDVEVSYIDHHVCSYSKAMNQPYPRVCVDCGKVEDTKPMNLKIK